MLQQGQFLLKRNNTIVILFLLILCGCSNNIYTIQELNPDVLVGTHKVSNSKIFDILKDFDETVKFDKNYDLTVIYLKKIDNHSYQLDIAKTKFNLFKKEKSSYYFKKLKGYLFLQNTLTVLYGDIDNKTFTRIKEAKIINIMNIDKKTKEDVLVYEPNFKQYNINISTIN